MKKGIRTMIRNGVVLSYSAASQKINWIKESDNNFSEDTLRIIMAQNKVDYFLDECNELDIVDVSWINFQSEMQSKYLNHPTNFLRLKPFLGVISMDSMPFNKELKYYLKTLGNKYCKNKLKILLKDDFIGKPFICSMRYGCTFVKAQHLYEILIFENNTGIKLLESDKEQIIMELGGGYGDMANLVFKNTKDVTYIIIDLPLMTTIQYLYLSQIYDKDRINIIREKRDKIVNNKINLLPINLLPSYEFKVDIFIATYSITESKRNLVDIPFEYIDTIRSSIPIDLLYGSITCVWKLLSLSLGIFNCFISPYFVFRSLLYFPFFIPGLFSKYAFNSISINFSILSFIAFLNNLSMSMFSRADMFISVFSIFYYLPEQKRYPSLLFND